MPGAYLGANEGGSAAAAVATIFGAPAIPLHIGYSLYMPAAHGSIRAGFRRPAQAVADDEGGRPLGGAAPLAMAWCFCALSIASGASDMAQLRATGIPSYGIGPASTEADRTNFGAHSDVERLREESLYRFVEFTWRAVTELSVH